MATPIGYGQLPPGTIRLLKFNETSVVGCVGSLEIFDLDEVPPYYALSYAWGRDLESTSLKLQEGTILLNPNLNEAIHHIRESTKGTMRSLKVKRIWIDKICINQNDVSERSIQVGLMGRIYAKSIRTLIWLGSNLGKCTGAWGLIDEVYRICISQNPGVQSIVDIPFKLYSKEIHVESGLSPFNHKNWKELNILLQDPWFTRAWIIQEVVVSTEDPIIIHGHHCYSWDRLGWAASWMRRNGFFRLPQIPEQLRNVDEVSNIRRSSKWPLDALLAATSVKFHATDQRDKVYALLGIAAEAHVPEYTSELLRPDYRLSVEQVYLRTARFLLQAKRSLAFLIRTRDISRQHIYDFADLPSWVPNWSDFTVSERDITKSFSWISYSKSGSVSLGFPKHCDASSGQPLAMMESADNEVLSVIGIRAGVISHCFDFHKPGLSNQDFIENFASIASNIFERAIRVPTITDVPGWLSGYIQTTTAEQHELSGRSPGLLIKDGATFILELLSSSDRQQSRVMSKNIQLDKDTIDSIYEISQGGDARIYEALARNFCFGRCLVLTSNYGMGLAPVNARAGDVVSVLYGSGVPYILRKGTEHWEFIGDSYFPRLARGEALQSSGSISTEGETFLLR
ncbi:hypothetical protein G7054_g930 [Neopestalotiopsis clavispora]|nr:hypothetical protein G7054_g930 [Neopestalotiopsis clavispora]